MRKPHVRRKCMDHIHVHERCKFARIGHLVVLSYKFKVMISCLVLFSPGFVMICGFFIYMRSAINFFVTGVCSPLLGFLQESPFCMICACYSSKLFFGFPAFSHIGVPFADFFFEIIVFISFTFLQVKIALK